MHHTSLITSSRQRIQEQETPISPTESVGERTELYHAYRESDIRLLATTAATDDHGYLVMVDRGEGLCRARSEHHMNNELQGTFAHEEKPAMEDIDLYSLIDHDSSKRRVTGKPEIVSQRYLERKGIDEGKREEDSNLHHQNIYDDPYELFPPQQPSAEDNNLEPHRRDKWSWQQGRDQHIFADPIACVVLQKVLIEQDYLDPKRRDEGLKRHGSESSQKDGRDHHIYSYPKTCVPQLPSADLEAERRDVKSRQERGEKLQEDGGDRHIYDDYVERVSSQQPLVEEGCLESDGKNECSKQESRDHHIYADQIAFAVVRQYSKEQGYLEPKITDEELEQHGREGSQKRGKYQNIFDNPNTYVPNLQSADYGYLEQEKTDEEPKQE